MVADDELWPTLRFAYYDIRATGDRECRDCSGGSTLSRPIVLTESARERARVANQKRREAFEAELKEAMDRLGLRFAGREVHA